MVLSRLGRVGKGSRWGATRARMREMDMGLSRRMQKMPASNPAHSDKAFTCSSQKMLWLTLRHKANLNARCSAQSGAFAPSHSVQYKVIEELLYRRHH